MSRRSRHFARKDESPSHPIWAVPGYGAHQDAAPHPAPAHLGHADDSFFVSPRKGKRNACCGSHRPPGRGGGWCIPRHRGVSSLIVPCPQRGQTLKPSQNGWGWTVADKQHRARIGRRPARAPGGRRELLGVRPAIPGHSGRAEMFNPFGVGVGSLSVLVHVLANLSGIPEFLSSKLHPSLYS